ncbi:MAG: sodium:solute symporter family protein [Chitinophagaceae bacterium]
MILAGRGVPLLLAVMTMTATWVDGGYILGTAEGAFSSLASAVQGGVGFGLSLILGGIFFAKIMRSRGYTTLIDPFEERFGKKWAAVLSLPALLGEVFWSAELLVAIGATFGVVLNMDLTTSILLSAAIVTFYTMLGGMWAVAYTDAFQLLLIPIGLIVALPFVFQHVGGVNAAWEQYHTLKGEAAGFVPPLSANGFWTTGGIASWWDVSAMLVLGGIPWNCYFQRVLSCKTPKSAKQQSIIAGIVTILLTVPPLLLGIVAVVYWKGDLANPTMAVPLMFRQLVPYWVGLLGLVSIVGAVTSSFSSSILSAGSMFTWNWYVRLISPQASIDKLQRIVRISVVTLGITATWMALKVKSVQALWFFTSDLVFVILFPQLVMVLFDKKTNRAGSIAAFSVSFLLRFGNGEPIFGLPRLIPYPDWWPVRIVAAGIGFILLAVVSRLTSRPKQDKITAGLQVKLV